MTFSLKLHPDQKQSWTKRSAFNRTVHISEPWVKVEKSSVNPNLVKNNLWCQSIATFQIQPPTCLRMCQCCPRQKAALFVSNEKKQELSDYYLAWNIIRVLTHIQLFPALTQETLSYNSGLYCSAQFVGGKFQRGGNFAHLRTNDNRREEEQIEIPSKMRLESGSKSGEMLVSAPVSEMGIWHFWSSEATYKSHPFFIKVSAQGD